MEYYILWLLLFCVFLIIKNQEITVNRSVSVYQLVLSLFLTLCGGVGLWVTLQRELESLTKTQEFQQKQIDEIKATSTDLKNSVRSIETNVADMKGDIKVLVSKIK